MKAWLRKVPSLTKILHVSLLSGLLFSACTWLSPPIENIAEPMGDNAAPGATPSVTATQPSSELPLETENVLENVSYSEFQRTFSFAYDPALAQGVEAETIEAVSLSQNGPYTEAHPAFAQFIFTGYDSNRFAQLPNPSRTPRLVFFPTEHFQEYGPDAPTGFLRQLEDLRNLLETEADLAERCTQTRPAGGTLHLPFLPWLNEAQVFCAQSQYVAFSGGKGIRYLTAFSQGILPLVESSAFYTFQGLSEDGEIYISAVFPVLTGVFPLEIHPGVEGQQPRNMTPAQLGTLNTQPGDLFQPALEQLDAVIRSLKVEE